MGNDSLKGIAAPIDDATAPDIAELVRDMQDTLVDIDSTGLAAPQIEVMSRLVL